MVGGQPLRVSLIGIGQNVVSDDFETAGHKNVVNAAVALGLQVVIVEGRFGGVPVQSLMISVDQGFSN